MPNDSRGRTRSRSGQPSDQAFRILHESEEAIALKNPLDSLWGTVICGFILTAILWFIAKTIVSHAIGAGA